MCELFEGAQSTAAQANACAARRVLVPNTTGRLRRKAGAAGAYTGALNRTQRRFWCALRPPHFNHARKASRIGWSKRMRHFEQHTALNSDTVVASLRRVPPRRGYLNRYPNRPAALSAVARGSARHSTWPLRERESTRSRGRISIMYELTHRPAPLTAAPAANGAAMGLVPNHARQAWFGTRFDQSSAAGPKATQTSGRRFQVKRAVCLTARTVVNGHAAGPHLSHQRRHLNAA